MALHFEYLKKVSDDAHRPLWSVMIPVYNCAAFLEDTLQCVMEQAPGNSLMEVVVVDDCSNDDPEAVVKKLGRGRVRYVRQPHNVGHTANFETCLSLSRGKLIHLLHGDDRVLPGFYREFTALFENEPSLMAAFCMYHFIDEHNHVNNTSFEYMKSGGEFTGFFDQITRSQIIQTPTIVVKREVYEKIGMFDHRLSWCEDWEMWARIAKHFPVGFINKILAEYRIHSGSNTGQYILSGENIRDLKRATGIVNSYIEDPESRKASHKISCAYYARYAMMMAEHFLEKKKKYAARNQLRAAFLMSKSPRVNLAIAKLFLKSI
ncbi:MAG: glycosyltransferase [Ginsengibacter sp.]